MLYIGTDGAFDNLATAITDLNEANQSHTKTLERALLKDAPTDQAGVAIALHHFEQMDPRT